MNPAAAFFLTALAGVLSLVCLWRSHAANRKFRLLTVMPTSRTQGVFIGLVELRGQAEGTPAISWLAEQPCLIFHWTVDEHWRRTVTETYRDQQGNTRTRTRVESGWDNVARGGETLPFYLQDETGQVLIQPEGAEIRPFTLFSETCRRGDDLYYRKGPDGAVANSTGQRRFVETGIPLHSTVFVVGQARERQDMVAAEVASAPDAPLYLVTAEDEAQVLKRYGSSRDWLNVLGILLAGGCGFGVAAMAGMDPVWPVVTAVLIYLVLWGASWQGMVYNSLVDSRNRVRQGWSLIEVQLKRRHDLIPPLVAAVDGLRAHEKGVTEVVALLRSQLEATPPGISGPDFHGTSASLTVLAEAYPVLKTSEAFLRLGKELTETEQRIALARDYFNEISSGYNTRLEVFPDSVLGRIFGFAGQPLLESAEFERAPVSVEMQKKPVITATVSSDSPPQENSSIPETPPPLPRFDPTGPPVSLPHGADESRAIQTE